MTKEENVEVPLPKWLFQILEQQAPKLGMSTDELAAQIVLDQLKNFKIEMRL